MRDSDGSQWRSQVVEWVTRRLRSQPRHTERVISPPQTISCPPDSCPVSPDSPFSHGSSPDPLEGAQVSTISCHTAPRVSIQHPTSLGKRTLSGSDRARALVGKALLQVSGPSGIAAMPNYPPADVTLPEPLDQESIRLQRTNASGDLCLAVCNSLKMLMELYDGNDGQDS